MKKLFAIITILFFFILPLISIADPPPPPGYGGSGGAGGGTPVGAPIDGGLGILIALGAIYGGKKIYDARKKKLAPEVEE
jgi:hypothetical protein